MSVPSATAAASTRPRRDSRTNNSNIKTPKQSRVDGLEDFQRKRRSSSKSATGDCCIIMVFCFVLALQILFDGPGWNLPMIFCDTISLDKMRHVSAVRLLIDSWSAERFRHQFDFLIIIILYVWPNVCESKEETFDVSPLFFFGFSCIALQTRLYNYANYFIFCSGFIF